MSAFIAGTRFFVAPDGKVIACPPITTRPETGNILYSPDGMVFYVVLGHSGSSSSTSQGYSQYNFYFQIPALGVTSAKLQYWGETDTVVYGDVTYELDESFDPANATIVDLKPVMRVVSLTSTHGGYIVEAQNEVDRKSHTYFNGKPVQVQPGSARARGDVETLLFIDGFGNEHRLDINGDHLDLTRQTATFDGRPAQVLIPDEYEFVFAEDLSAVTVSKK